jgi:uncharacterized protein
MFLTLFIVGLVVGILSSLLGIGGGALIVPTLLTLYPKMPVQVVTATSLCFIFLNSLINNFKFYRNAIKIHYKSSMKLNVSAIVGGIIGAKLVLDITPTAFRMGFAAVLFFISMRLFFSKMSEAEHLDETQIKSYKFYLTGFIGGLISSLTGLGGGAIFVPLLITFVGLPIIMISPYSNLAMSFATLSGLLPHLFIEKNYHWEEVSILNNFQIGNVSIALPIILLLGATITSSIGVKLNTSMKDKTKKMTFAFLLLILSIKTLISVYK